MWALLLSLSPLEGFPTFNGEPSVEGDPSKKARGHTPTRGAFDLGDVKRSG